MAPKRNQKVSIDELPRPGHKRAKVDDPVGAKVTSISEAIADTQLVEIEGTAVNRKMLIEIVPLTLKVPCSERHTYQTSVATMIGEVLNSSKDQWEQKVSNAQKVVDGTNAERSSAAAARDEANDQVKEQEVVVTNCKEEVQKHAEEEHAAGRALQVAAKEVSEFEDAQKEKAKKLAEYNATYKDNFEAIQSPTEALSAKDQKMHLSKLTGVLKELSADASLITVLQAVAKKMPSERSTFDSLAMENVSTLLKKSIDALQSDLDNGGDLKAQKINAKDAEQAVLDAAKEAHKASKDSLKAATEALMARQTETKAALKTLVSKVTEAENAVKQHAEQQKGFQKVQNVVANFEFLLERDVPPPENSKVEAMSEESPAVVEPVQAMQQVA